MRFFTPENVHPMAFHGFRLSVRVCQRRLAASLNHTGDLQLLDSASYTFCPRPHPTAATPCLQHGCKVQSWHDMLCTPFNFSSRCAASLSKLKCFKSARLQANAHSPSAAFGGRHPMQKCPSSYCAGQREKPAAASSNWCGHSQRQYK